MNAIQPGRGLFGRLWAMLRLRCPRCFRGPVFKGSFEMDDPCRVCGHVFQREEGYFLGAMYVSYALGCGLVSIAYFLGAWWWPSLPSYQLCLLLLAVYVPLMPAVFRYSRIIFMHLDYLVGQGYSSESSYVQLRRRQLNTTPATSPENRDARTPPG